MALYVTRHHKPFCSLYRALAESRCACQRHLRAFQLLIAWVLIMPYMVE